MKLLAALLFTSLVLLPLGCGYQSGQITSGEGQSIAVPIFVNETFRRDLEKDLTRTVQKEITARTNFHLVPRDRADLVLEGRILSIQEGVISEREKAIIRESSVIVTVEIRVTNQRTGELVLKRTELKERQPFAPGTGQSLRTAEIAAFNVLAEKIVYSLQSGW